MARDGVRAKDIQRITAALEAFRARHGQYPPIEPIERTMVGLSDGCTSIAHESLVPDFLPEVAEDPLFAGGYVQPGPTRWCYYYRKGPGLDTYTLFVRFEISAHADAAGCQPPIVYRAELEHFNCAVARPPETVGGTGRASVWDRLLQAPPKSLPPARATRWVSLLALVAAVVVVVRRRPDPATGPSAPEGAVAGLDRKLAAIALLTTLLAFHAVTFALLTWYYRNYLPHFDSIGSYTSMASILNFAQSCRMDEAIRSASAVYLSWLHGMFPVVFAPLLSPSPAGLQLLNTLCVGTFSVCTYAVCRELGGGRQQAYLASLVLLLPEAMSYWDGGLQDMRRDSSFICLLGATFALVFAQGWRPSARRGAALGAVAGLTVWTRGEAIVYMAAILGPIVVGLALRRWREAGGPGVLRAWLWPASVFWLVALPNLIGTAEQNLARRLGLVDRYVPDTTFWESFSYYVHTPAWLWAGREPGRGVTDSVQTLGFAHTAFFFLAAAAVSRGVAGPRRRQGDMLAGGAWAVVATLLLVVGQGWDPGFGTAGWPPLYPTLLGPLALAVVVLSALRPGQTPDRRHLARRWAVLTLVGSLSVGLAGVRMFLKAPEQADPVETAEELTTLLQRHKQDATIAALTRSRISFNTLLMAEVVRGVPVSEGFRKFAWQLPSGAWVDWAWRIPPDADVGTHQELLFEQLRERAHFVILDADLDAYRAPPDAWNWFVFRHGASVATSVLEDPQFERIYEYQLRGRRYVVLRNDRLVAPLQAAGTGGEREAES